MTTVLDFLRHGEPVGGRKYRGQVDDALSELGWAQMHAAVGEAAPWTRIVASPLLRCRAFAEVLAAQRGLPLFFDPRLKEVGFGEWEGKSAAEIEQAAPGTLARFKADPINARPAGAEALPDFLARVSAALDELVARHAGEHVLVVGHAGVMRMALAWALDIPLQQAYRIEVANASFTRLRCEGGRSTLVFHGSARVEA
ncbi:alpha-ribazole-5`-phosphate phosphatase CobC, putative [Thiobacillus denitrificans ATCC 25259]|uniref:Alpha-ribazole-5`-phosphate phosphatase CobC, putative n=1 Tax=Thiobacillus denitrificans (strain ATCC 25259 / T1) TaxID=292415 RepID=Q3SJS6_THIDA|nr:alpha-ribazole phosphatase family protein [Thiobacillus denitrificans]AAZ97074.1 alpha-ribazole-5`-phosphate phosphatase CobC, putative [Thiobacillus denitrificans ATCC 25259]